MRRSPALYYAVIGDVIRSRAEDQRAMFTALKQAMEWVNQETGFVEELKLAPAAGDEIQGLCADLAEALRATLFVQLKLKGDYELRFGIGYGTAESFEALESTAGRSGTAWWNARDAIDNVSELQGMKKGLPREGIRTSVSLGKEGDPLMEGLANALLLFRDQVLEGLSRRDAAVTLGLFAGRRQVDIAGDLGVSQSLVSDVSRKKGAAALIRCQELVEEAVRRIKSPEGKAKGSKA